eukprot:scaffold163561_cov64-Cyclotella_meneghiniana.AAC.2
MQSFHYLMLMAKLFGPRLLVTLVTKDGMVESLKLIVLLSHLLPMSPFTGCSISCHASCTGCTNLGDGECVDSIGNYYGKLA